MARVADLIAALRYVERVVVRLLGSLSRAQVLALVRTSQKSLSVCGISIYQAELDHERDFHDGRQAQYRMTAERELFCRDCGRPVPYTRAVSFPEMGGPQKLASS